MIVSILLFNNFVSQVSEFRLQELFIIVLDNFYLAQYILFHLDFMLAFARIVQIYFIFRVFITEINL